MNRRADAPRPQHVNLQGRGTFHATFGGRVLRTGTVRAPVHGPDARQNAVGAFHEPGVERDRVGLLPLPARNERGEGRGEGKSNKDRLLSPALSSFVPQEEREKSSVHGPKACAIAKEGSP